MANEPIEVASRFDFQQWVLEANLPVVVHFFGRSQESRQLSGKLSALAREYRDRIRMVFVDMLAADRLCADYRIKPAHDPTVMLFMAGRPVKRWGNEQNLDEYRRGLETVLLRVWTPAAHLSGRRP